LNGEDSTSSRCEHLRLHLFSSQVEDAEVWRDPLFCKDARSLNSPRFPASFFRAIFCDFRSMRLHCIIVTAPAFVAKERPQKMPGQKRKSPAPDCSAKAQPQKKSRHARRRITNHELKDHANYAIMQIPWKDPKGIVSGKCSLQ